MIAKPARTKTAQESPRLWVKPVDGELGLIYEVESRSDPEFPHRVDLSLNGGLGACSCRGFQCKSKKVQLALLEKRPLLDLIFRKEFTCEHLRCVHWHWHCVALPAVIKAHQQGTV